VLTTSEGLPDGGRIAHLSDQIAELKKKGTYVIVVSSGAVASGRSLLRLPQKLNPVAERQVLASVGQVRLMQLYAEAFGKHGLVVSQILVTKEDFRDKTHYLNMRQCFESLLQQNIVPIVNENDVVSVTELMFTDNDELSGLVASMMEVDALLILSNVDGVYNGNPKEENAKVVPVISRRSDFEGMISAEKSSFGRGGMLTKCRFAQKTAALGIAVYIANGKKENIICDLLAGKPVGTLFVPQKRKSRLKAWMAHAEGTIKGEVHINEGAEKALFSKPTSLLPVGITKISGNFQKGDLLKIINSNNEVIGIGIAKYDATTALHLIGLQNQPELIHYDYLLLY
ncbi:MAG: glutamate 5-kinase, partial [Flammeovirgaceae bacterium]|nr:glutamate 5-kinase [Flammeovirgaceae bacterium]